MYVQTERYASDGQQLAYKLPMPMSVDGVFVLNLKFSEVYFDSPGQKVFSMDLNGARVLDRLDIFDKVGFGAAYDEHIEFRLDNKEKLLTVGEQSVPYDGQLDIQFVAEVDNPKVNALLVTKGTLAEFKRYRPPKRRKPKAEVENDTELTIGVQRKNFAPAISQC